jgi:hypothetical protein
MTAVALPRPVRPGGAFRVSSGRLLRLELRRNPMMWMVPVAAALFWFDAYRRSMAFPALWSARCMYLREGAVLMDFAPFVAGAAAWAGARDGRRGTAEQVAITALPRWAARLSAWAATACWALAGYALCIGVLFGVTAAQGATGSPLWWPVLVDAVGILAFSAFGFALGTWVPSRFTAPLTAIVALLSLAVTRKLGGDVMLVSPVGSPAYSVSAPNPQDGVFYPFVPDISYIQIMFLGGLTLALAGTLGLRGHLRRPVAAVTAVVAGLVVAGTGVGLANTVRLQTNGAVIPALHDSADDIPVHYRPVCTGHICLHPDYKAYLKVVATAVEPVFTELDGLPGAPVKLTQTMFTNDDPGISAATVSGTPPVLHAAFAFGFQGTWSVGYGGGPNAGPGPGPATPPPTDSAHLWLNLHDVTAEAVPPVAVAAFDHVVGHATQAQQGVAGGLVLALGLPFNDVVATGAFPPPAAPAPGSPVYAAAHRFAALPSAARHAWLMSHLAALRAGQITVEQIP